MTVYRKMVAADIEAALALCRSAGWNQLENDWKIFLELSPDGSRVAIDDNNNILGTVATINYEDRFSWIGMVLVDPSKKRQGIGTRLLLEALNILSGQQTVKLDATPAGREVYLKKDFKDEYTLSRMVLTNTINLPATVNVSNTTEKDFTRILELDKEVFGASREDLLRRLHKNHSAISLVIKNGSRTAYSFGRKGFNFTQVGPVVAEHLDDAKQLVTGALRNAGQRVVMDVMDNSPFKQWLVSLGFTEQRKLIRMYRGNNAYPGDPAKQFAILGPEFG